MCFPSFRLLSVALILVGLANVALGQEVESKNQDATQAPSWVSDSIHIPLERERAVQKLIYFMESDYLRQPDDVARQMVIALNGAGLPEEPRSKLDEWYARLIQRRVESWKTSEIRAKIRVEIVRRDARTRQMEKRLARIAADLADLVTDGKGSAVAVSASDALEAAGYVVVNGQLLKRTEAYPTLGISR